MRFIFIFVIILFPKISFGGIGDVYYCTGKKFIMIENYKHQEYEPQNFKFKRTGKILKFGSEDNFFKGHVLSEVQLDMGTELFKYRSETDYFFYGNGKFNYTMNSYEQIVSITGTCSIF